MIASQHLSTSRTHDENVSYYKTLLVPFVLSINTPIHYRTLEIAANNNKFFLSYYFILIMKELNLHFSWVNIVGG